MVFRLVPAESFGSTFRRTPISPGLSLLTVPRPPRAILLPYTTLFRSLTVPGRPQVQLELVHPDRQGGAERGQRDRKSTRLNSSHVAISYAVFCLKKKNIRFTNRTPEGRGPDVAGMERRDA